ncbi:isochorismatase family protein [Sphingomonas leidyi]|uniref:isochorismatase family protein n=1 Tax=Sphingomonas leidyi TaxID=68569 RepID=UPI0036D33CAD
MFDMWAEPGLAIERVGAREAADRDAFFAGLRGAGIEAVTVVGVAADYCVRWAVEGLIARGFRVTVPAELTRGIARPIDQVAAEEWPGAAVAIEGAEQ